MSATGEQDDAGLSPGAASAPDGGPGRAIHRAASHRPARHRPARHRAAEAIVLAALLLLAALIRLPGLDQRGQWDADQAQEMQVLRALVTQGDIPLLGPSTSGGAFHHGADYYLLLAPAAYLSAADPVAVTTEIALLGVAAVAAVWWLGRLAGGPVAAAAAGLLAAVSPAWIDDSTLIWNPSPVPFLAAMAFGLVLHARATGRARWWTLAGVMAALVVQCHVLGVLILPPLATAWLMDLWARRRQGRPLSPVLRGGAGIVAAFVVGCIPLAVYETSHGFAELRGIIGLLGSGASAGGSGLLARMVVVPLRTVTWPLSGLVTDHPAGSLVALALALGLGVVAVAARGKHRAGEASCEASDASTDASADGPGVQGARWLAGAFVFGTVALALAVPTLAVVTPGLPNDHYHAFLDPLVLVLAGIGAARLAAWRPTPTGSGAAWRGLTAGRGLAAGSLALLVAVAVSGWPPAVSPDGGWQLADAAAGRILADAARIAPGAPIVLDGLPAIKPADSIGFPLARRGAVTVGPASGGVASAVAGLTILVCDPLLEQTLGPGCGGPAEDAWLAAHGATGARLVDRFSAGSRRVVSAYASSGSVGG